MRVGLITQWFPPEPSLIPLQLARALSDIASDVTVLTGFPNYPSGKVHPEYRLRPYAREERGSAAVLRTFLVPYHGPSPLKRAANYISFAASAAIAGQTPLLPAQDVWVIYSSPATAALPLTHTPRHRKTPKLLIIQDLWPDSVVESGLARGGDAIYTKFLTRMVDSIYRRTDRIAVISPSMKQVLVQRGVPEDKIRYLPNWLDDSHLFPHCQPSAEARLSLGMPSETTFLYAGNMGTLQRLDSLILGFGQVPDAHLVLLGGGVKADDLRRLVCQNNIKNVTFLDAVPHSAVGRYIAAADFSVVSLGGTKLLAATMPSKVQASLAAGRPILAHMVGDGADLIKKHSAGATCTPGEPEDVASAVRQLLALSPQQRLLMRQRARALYETEFSPTVGKSRLAAILHEIVS